MDTTSRLRRHPSDRPPDARAPHGDGGQGHGLPPQEDGAWRAGRRRLPVPAPLRRLSRSPLARWSPAAFAAVLTAGVLGFYGVSAGELVLFTGYAVLCLAFPG